jgi:hypothetical protein
MNESGCFRTTNLAVGLSFCCVVKEYLELEAMTGNLRNKVCEAIGGAWF